MQYAVMSFLPPCGCRLRLSHSGFSVENANKALSARASRIRQSSSLSILTCMLVESAGTPACDNDSRSVRSHVGSVLPKSINKSEVSLFGDWMVNKSEYSP